ncbi:MAG: hypothetical protein QM831_32725 [Kofleriaceae bacterium]
MKRLAILVLVAACDNAILYKGEQNTDTYDPPPDAPAVDPHAAFVSYVQPLLNQDCNVCHTAENSVQLDYATLIQVGFSQTPWFQQVPVERYLFVDGTTVHTSESIPPWLGSEGATILSWLSLETAARR